MCIVVIVAPPIVVGVWSMAFLLSQHVKLVLLTHSTTQTDTCQFMKTCLTCLVQAVHVYIHCFSYVNDKLRAGVPDICEPHNRA